MSIQIDYTPRVFHRLLIYAASHYAAYENLKTHENGLEAHGDRSGASDHRNEFNVTHEEAIISYKANPNFCSASFAEFKHHTPSLNRKELLAVPCSPLMCFSNPFYLQQFQCNVTFMTSVISHLNLSHGGQHRWEVF